jgi:L-ascorbate metabolism protein UlaG (beta-lactamase superfamily)
MKIKWLGHSCFKITSSKGIRILTDPFDDNVGYKIPSVEADIVTTSHGHYDHNFVDCVKGDFEVLNKVGNFYIKDIPIAGIHTYHDNEDGAKRGDNVIYVFDIDGMRVCHLGDLGHLLTPGQIGMIGKVDFLLIPIGGNYTIDADAAIEVINQINPKIIIPMHYKTQVIKFDIDTVDNFLNKIGSVERVQSQVLEFSIENLPKEGRRVYTLKYE